MKNTMVAAVFAEHKNTTQLYENYMYWLVSTRFITPNHQNTQTTTKKQNPISIKWSKKSSENNYPLRNPKTQTDCTRYRLWFDHLNVKIGWIILLKSMDLCHGRTQTPKSHFFDFFPCNFWILLMIFYKFLIILKSIYIFLKITP